MEPSTYVTPLVWGRRASTARLRLQGCCVERVGPGVGVDLVAGAGGVVGWVARCWALRNQAALAPGWCVAGVLGFLVVVWLLDSGREHLCSCFAQIDSVWRLVLLWWCGRGGCLLCFVVFVCVATSYEGRMVDALASRADEGRRSLR